MSGDDSLDPEALLAVWADRWRYPSLLVALADRDAQAGASPTEPARVDVCEALLEGLATPVDDPAAALTDLVRRGEFPAALGLAESTALEDTLVGPERPDDYVRAAQRAAEAEINARRASLRQRARRAGLSGEPPEAAAPANGQPWRRAAAETKLREWTETLEAQEARIAAGIDHELAALDRTQHAELIDQVNGCLAAREYPTAAQLLRARPVGHVETGGPRTVARQSLWPWLDRDAEEILGWYRDEDPPPAFSRWRPSPGDATAECLLAAVTDLLARPGGEAPVGAFARALDRSCGTDGVRHTVTPLGAGHRSVLLGASDGRFPWLALPRSLPLYVGPPDWVPPDGCPLGVWFVPAVLGRGDPRQRAAAPGLAILDLTNVFQLLAPTRDTPGNTVFRRVNLIREICRQLTVADLLGPRSLLGEDEPVGEPGASGGSSPALRDALAWLLDLLGVQAEAGVLDVLLHDTGQRTGALRAAVTDLLAGARLERAITLPDVAAWRNSQTCMANLRATILPAVGDLEVAVVVDAAVWRFGEQARPFTAAEIDECLAQADARPGSPGQEDAPAEEAEPVHVAEALERARPLGLFEPSAGLGKAGDTVYAWTDQALPLLLAALDLEQRVAQGLALLRRRRQLSKANALEAKKRASLAGALHRVKGRAFVVRQYLDLLLTADPTSAETTETARRAIDVLITMRPFWRLLNEASMDAYLTKGQYDLTGLLKEIQLGWGIDHRDTPLELAGATGEPLRVHGSEQMVEDSLSNLLDNAANAIGKGSGRVRLTVRRHDLPADQPTVTLDLEDSGPGFESGVLAQLADGGVTPTEDGGHGIKLARDYIEYNDGILEILGSSAALGGAHLRVTLPLDLRPELRHGC